MVNFSLPFAPARAGAFLFILKFLKSGLRYNGLFSGKGRHEAAREQKEFNMPGKITVANKYSGATGISIMRGTPLGNLFKLDDYSREESINNYLVLLRTAYKYRGIVNKNMSILEKSWIGPAYKMLMELFKKVKSGQNLTLICVCKPKACHGDIIKMAIEKIIEKE